MIRKNLIGGISPKMQQFKGKEGGNSEGLSNRTHTGLSDEQKKVVSKKIIETFHENLDKAKESINGDFNTALDYLKKYCTEIDDGVECYGKPFKKVTIKIPETNGFNGNELTFYVEIGDGCCNGKQFKENNCGKYSFSRNDIKNNLNIIKKFLISVGVNPYEKVDTFYEKYEIDRSGICMKRLLGLEENKNLWDYEGYYRLKDKLFGFGPDYYQLVSKENGLVIKKGFYNYGDFGRNDIGKLLLKSLPNEENQI